MPVQARLLRGRAAERLRAAGALTDPSVWAGFGAEAAAYERGRADYPDEAVAWLAERLGIAPGRRVVDLAAGTGKLTRKLVATGAEVVAVEPADGMRTQLRRVLPEVEALAGRAEELPLPDGSVDAVTVAQAFHWFATEEALTEIARVLRPGGGLGLVWNVRDTSDPLQAALGELLESIRPPTHRHAGVAWTGVLEASPRFGPVESASFANTQRLTPELLADRVGSVSFVAIQPEPERRELLARVRALAGEGEVELPYETRVYAAPRA